MLVISRVQDEKVIIATPDGTVITVMVVDFRGVKQRKVRLGIDAPKDVVIHREEIWDMLQERSSRADGTEHDAPDRHDAGAGGV